MEDLINKYYNDYLTYCYRLTNNKKDAEDLLHDVVIKLYEHKDRYISVNKSFIYVVIKNMFLDTWRKTKDYKFVNDDELIKLEADVSDLLDLRYKVEDVASKLSYLEHNLLLDSRSMRAISRESGVTVRKIKTVMDNAKNNFKKKWLEVENQKDLEI